MSRKQDSIQYDEKLCDIDINLLDFSRLCSPMGGHGRKILVIARYSKIMSKLL